MDIVGKLELHSLLSAIITRAAKLMNTEHGFIYLLNEAQTEMILQIKLGHYKTLPVPPLKKGQGLAGHVWELAQPFTINDYSGWEKD
jgi:signal transduction protein with GAF and PtsI domain